MALFVPVMRRDTSSKCSAFRPRTSLLNNTHSFGFLDGISNPAIENIDTKPLPGQETIRQGITLLGRNGDPTKRPTWALDGSFLVFRYLFQLVPEFNDFLSHHAIPGLSKEDGAQFLGARLVGRWKSGMSINLRY